MVIQTRTISHTHNSRDAYLETETTRIAGAVVIRNKTAAVILNHTSYNNHLRIICCQSQTLSVWQQPGSEHPTYSTISVAALSAFFEGTLSLARHACASPYLQIPLVVH